MRVDARELWLTSSCAAPAAESWYRKRVAASLRLSNTIARKQRREEFCPNLLLRGTSIPRRRSWRIIIRLDLFLSVNRHDVTFVVVPFFPPFALLCFRRDVWKRTTRDETNERPYRVLKGTARLLLARIHDSGYRLVNGNAHRFMRGAQRIEPVMDGLPTSTFEILI